MDGSTLTSPELNKHGKIEVIFHNISYDSYLNYTLEVPYNDQSLGAHLNKQLFLVRNAINQYKDKLNNPVLSASTGYLILVVIGLVLVCQILIELSKCVYRRKFASGAQLSAAMK